MLNKRTQAITYYHLETIDKIALVQDTKYPIFGNYNGTDISSAF